MNENNNRAKYLLIGVVLLGALIFFAWQLVLVPMDEADRLIAERRTKLDDKEKEFAEMNKVLKVSEKRIRQQSLPANSNQSSLEYGQLLKDLMSGSKLTVKNLNSTAPDSRSVPQLPGKKPAYTKLTYTVSARGDYQSVLDFMASFYRQPLLHQIKKINITVPQTQVADRGGAGPAPGGGDGAPVAPGGFLGGGAPAGMLGAPGGLQGGPPQPPGGPGGGPGGGGPGGGVFGRGGGGPGGGILGGGVFGRGGGNAGGGMGGGGAPGGGIFGRGGGGPGGGGPGGGGGILGGFAGLGGSGRRGGGGGTDLDVVMTIEAIIVDKAPDRPNLVSIPPQMGMMAGGLASTGWIKHPSSKAPNVGSPFWSTSTLAHLDPPGLPTPPTAAPKGSAPPQKAPTTPLEYLKMTGKDIFHGPPPPTPEKKEAPEPKGPTDRDFSPFLRLTSVTHEEGIAKAELRNMYNKDDYVLTQKSNGDSLIQHYYYEMKTVGNDVRISVRKEWYDDRNTHGQLIIGSANRGNRKDFNILRIVETGVLIQLADDGSAKDKKNQSVALFAGGLTHVVIPGKVYRWETGQTLSEAVEGKSVVTRDGPQVTKATPLTHKEAQRALLHKMGLSSEVVTEPPSKKQPDKRR